MFSEYLYEREDGPAEGGALLLVQGVGEDHPGRGHHVGGHVLGPLGGGEARDREPTYMLDPFKGESKDYSRS